MSLDYINEAFRSLELLTEDVFKADAEGFADLADFMDSEDTAEEKISIIDMDAETEDDLQDSYVGKVIVDCNICHSHVFMNKDEIILDAEGLVDIEEDCPYCGENNGFVIIGEIHEFKPEGEEVDTVEVEAEEQPAAEDDNSIEESLKEGIGDYDVYFEERVAPKILDAAEKLLNAQGYTDVYFDADVLSNRDLITATKDGVRYSAKLDLEDELDTFYSFRNKIKKCAKWYADEIVKKFNGIEESLKEEKNSEKLFRKFPELRRSVTESFKNVSLETEDERMTMTAEDNGKVTVTTEPIQEADSGEMLAPVSADTENEIINANAEIIDEQPAEEVAVEGELPEEELPEEEELEFDIDEVDEESMNELGESYLKRVYENVESFKLTNCSTTPSQLVLEGLITFKSGVKKNTGFIFEAKDATKDGKVRFIGENAHLSRGRKAFTLIGSMNESKKLVCESFSYNYRAKDGEGKSTKVYGKITRK